ncbi:Lrp/AsnC family transcriptional regulator [Emticicia sp. TH156]|uniref:Lrp/AsnC family transcriptional regulator n=1 Tax=Emticicia sp. TH156 TaxID=2067454 RepID=UPI000C794CF6|nr:Lrp/AsnC family transcriptional regulator [Emticicia sp. TH156]PLK46419.1 ArsR family transcriptional regulator [Emticicia sp. TH156]
MQEPDEYDRKILALLQKNNKTTAEEIGTIISLSTSAVQRRLKKLRDDKIIEADISVVSSRALGFNISCIVDVSLHVGSSKVIDSFKNLVSGLPEVSQCYYVTGIYDFVLIVNTRDMKHYEEFSKKYLMDNEDVKQFYTHVMMDKVKFELAINL